MTRDSEVFHLAELLAAGVPHRFEKITENLLLLVIFAPAESG